MIAITSKGEAPPSPHVLDMDLEEDELEFDLGKAEEAVFNAIGNSEVTAKYVLGILMDYYPDLAAELMVYFPYMLSRICQHANKVQMQDAFRIIFDAVDAISIFGVKETIAALDIQVIAEAVGESVVGAMPSSELADSIREKRGESLEDFFENQASLEEKYRVVESLAQDADVMAVGDPLELICALVAQGKFGVFDVFGKDQITKAVSPSEYWDMMTKEEQLEWLGRL